MIGAEASPGYTLGWRVEESRTVTSGSALQPGGNEFLVTSYALSVIQC
jgi:hypothetical protein